MGEIQLFENRFRQHALRIRNKPLLGQLVLRVLERAQRRATAEPQRSATELAVEEMERLVTGWFADVLQTSPTNADQMLSTRGRLALLLADMPGKWQDQFLRPGMQHRNAAAQFACRPPIDDHRLRRTYVDSTDAGFGRPARSCYRPHHHMDTHAPWP